MNGKDIERKIKWSFANLERALSNSLNGTTPPPAKKPRMCLRCSFTSDSNTKGKNCPICRAKLVLQNKKNINLSFNKDTKDLEDLFGKEGMKKLFGEDYDKDFLGDNVKDIGQVLSKKKKAKKNI